MNVLEYNRLVQRFLVWRNEEEPDSRSWLDQVEREWRMFLDSEQPLYNGVYTMSQTTHTASPGVAPQAHPAAANGKPKERTEKDKKLDAEMALALLLTDWLHGDRHFQAQLTKLTLEMLTDLGGGPNVKEPDEQQQLARDAKARLEGAVTDTRPQDQPAMRQDERRLAPPQAEHAAAPAPATKAH